MLRGGAVVERTRGRGGGRGGGGGNKRQCNNQPVGGKDGCVRQRMTRGRDDERGRHVNEVEESRIGENCGNIH